MRNLFRGIAVFGGILVASVLLGKPAHAVTPQDQRTDRAWAANIIQGSTMSATVFNNTGGVSITISSAGANLQNCLGYIELDMPVFSTFTITDGGPVNSTAIFQKLGTAITLSSATAQSGRYERVWNKSEPLCGSPNTSMFLTIKAGSLDNVPAVINYEGYVPARN